MFANHPLGRPSRFVRLALELLEDRFLPAPIVVNSIADTAAPPPGTVTLRSAIIQAETDPAGDTITFDPSLSGQTIALTGPLPNLQNAETIQGLGPNKLTINAEGNGNIFNTGGRLAVTITGLTLTGGMAATGGAITDAGTLVLTNDVLTNNTTTNGEGDVGGAIANSGTLQVANSVIADNSTGNGAGDSGGAIYSYGGTTVQLTNDLIGGNTAGNGGGDAGGIFIVGGTLTITNSTIAKNSTQGGPGGGIDAEESTLTINDSTVTGNTAQNNFSEGPAAGGIYFFAFDSGGTFTLNNTIVAGNFAPGTSPDAVGVTSGSGNFIGQGDALLGGIVNDVNGNQVGTAANVLNPQLGPLQDNGGPTPTEAPLVGSPVINAGVNGVIPAGVANDQRGFLRIVGPAVDIGAVEFQPPVVTSLADNPGSIAFGQATTLTAIVQNTSPAPNNPLVGVVAFFNGATLIGTVPLNAATGQATISFTPPSGGTFSLGATFTSNGPYAPSNALPVSLPVATVPANTALSASPASLFFGQTTTLAATVTAGPSAPAGSAPTGLVTFFTGSTSIGTASIGVGGVATITFTPPAAGTDVLEASYSGDSDFSPGTSPLVNLPVAPDPTNTALTISPTTVIFGQPLTLTATVTLAPDPPLNGTVTFFNGKSALGTVPVNGNGVATLTLTPPTLAPLQLSATFNGTNNFASSSSATLQVNVGRPAQTIGVMNPFNATWYLKNSNAPGAPDIAPFAYGGENWDGLTGDWTGDGQDTIAVVNPSTMVWDIKFSNSPGAPDIAPFAYGAPYWIPLAGDWTGSGQDTIAVVDPTTMTWYIKFSNSPGAPDIAPFRYGPPGSIPVVGDWNGTGHDGIGVYDPSTGIWYLRNEDSPGAPDAGVFQYGGIGWTPVVGDWSGTGKSTVGVFDPSSGTWYIKFTNTPGAPDVPPFRYGGTAYEAFAGAWQLQGGQGLQADFAGSGQQPLNNAALQTVVSAALARLTAAGVSSSLVRQLASVQFEISTSLPLDTLALSYVGSDLVEVSATAAGRGWFTDASASSDAEYVNGSAQPNTPAATGMDLLTTVLHEMGHFNGRVDLPASATAGLMADVLGAGQRDVQGLDQVFVTGF